eukprot:92094_1
MATQNVLNIIDKAHLILKNIGYESYRGKQLECITHTIMGGDSMVIMATGSGKSLCYIIPPLYYCAPCLIISPLLSLIQNQISILTRLNLTAIHLRDISREDIPKAGCIYCARSIAIVFVTHASVRSLSQMICRVISGESCHASNRMFRIVL